MQLQRVDSGDWEARRLTPRRYYPPKPKTDKTEPNTVDPNFTGQIAPPRPPIYINAPQGIIFGYGSNRNGRRALMVQFGMVNPFLDETLRFMRRCQGQWNPTFNLWQVPIISQTVRTAMKESWVLAQDALLEPQWGWHIEMLVRWPQLTDNELRALDQFVTVTNNFWALGIGNLEIATDLAPVAIFSKDELAQRVSEHMLTHAKGENKQRRTTARHWVNYLRHQHTAYEARLRLIPYAAQEDYALQVFQQCNNAIAEAYPYLSKEVLKQNAWRLNL